MTILPEIQIQSDFNDTYHTLFDFGPKQNGQPPHEISLLSLHCPNREKPFAIAGVN